MTAVGGAGDSPLACPRCSTPMRVLVLGRKPHGTVAVDLCPGCRGLWFDSFESLQLTAEATLALLREAAAASGGQAPGPAAPLPCPRCRRALAATQDVQRATRFTYWRCPQGHGRFTPFTQFMREKDCVRPLSAAELAQVRAQIGTVRCSGCGASVDLGRESRCRYCGAHVEVLDPEAVRRAVAGAAARTPAAPEAAMDALLSAQRARPGLATGTGADLVFGGLATLLDVLAAS